MFVGLYVIVLVLSVYAVLSIRTPLINIWTLLFATGVWVNVKLVCPTVAKNWSLSSVSGAETVHAEPTTFNTYPAVLGLNVVTPPVPFPMISAPLVNVVWPVPP